MVGGGASVDNSVFTVVSFCLLDICCDKLEIQPHMLITYMLLRIIILAFNAGFNVETVEYKNISFTVWDVGGQDKVLQYDHCFYDFCSMVSN